MTDLWTARDALGRFARDRSKPEQSLSFGVPEPDVFVREARKSGVSVAEIRESLCRFEDGEPDELTAGLFEQPRPGESVEGFYARANAWVEGVWKEVGA